MFVLRFAHISSAVPCDDFEEFGVGYAVVLSSEAHAGNGDTSPSPSSGPGLERWKRCREPSLLRGTCQEHSATMQSYEGNGSTLASGSDPLEFLREIRGINPRGVPNEFHRCSVLLTVEK